MKRFYPIIALILAAFLLAACQKDTAAKTSGVDAKSSVSKADPNYDPYLVDQLFYNSEKNVELAIFRVADFYLSFVEADKGVAPAWIRVEGSIPAEVDISDGGFALITADITRLTGGEGGFSGEPEIDRLISFRKAELAEMIEYCGIDTFDPLELTRYNVPLIYGDYLIIDLYGTSYIYKNGEPVGAYENEFEAQCVMGAAEMPAGDVKMEYTHNENLYIFRCGDKYLSYCRSIFMNRYWTPILNREFKNLPTGFELADGDAVEISAEIVSINGGDAGYVNAPLIMSVKNVTPINEYDALIVHAEMIPFWGGSYTQSDGESAVEWIERLYPAETMNGFYDYFGGVWLLFYVDGKYHIYLDDTSTKKLVGVYDTFNEAEDVLTRHGG